MMNSANYGAHSKFYVTFQNFLTGRFSDPTFDVMFDAEFLNLRVYIESDFGFKCEPIGAINMTSVTVSLYFLVFTCHKLGRIDFLGTKKRRLEFRLFARKLTATNTFQ